MALSKDDIRELAQGFISESDGDCSSIDRAELALQLRAAGDDISDDDVEAVAVEIEGLSLPDIHCEECGRVFTQGTDSGRPDGECPGCGHVNTRAFGVQQGEELVRVENNGIFELDFPHGYQGLSKIFLIFLAKLLETLPDLDTKSDRL